jgi:hypothetical protein
MRYTDGRDPYDPIKDEGGLELWVEHEYSRVRDTLVPMLHSQEYISPHIDAQGSLMVFTNDLVTQVIGAHEGYNGRQAAYRGVHLARTITSITVGRPVALTEEAFRARYLPIPRLDVMNMGRNYLLKRPALRTLVMNYGLPHLDRTKNASFPVRMIAGLTLRHLDLAECDRASEAQVVLMREDIKANLDATATRWAAERGYGQNACGYPAHTA